MIPVSVATALMTRAWLIALFAGGLARHDHTSFRYVIWVCSVMWFVIALKETYDWLAGRDL